MYLLQLLKTLDETIFIGVLNRGLCSYLFFRKLCSVELNSQIGLFHVAIPWLQYGRSCFVCVVPRCQLRLGLMKVTELFVPSTSLTYRYWVIATGNYSQAYRILITFHYAWKISKYSYIKIVLISKTLFRKH